MYYDLCPWRNCGCPFCVEVPSNPQTMRPLLTTSTLFPRQEEEPTTTTEASYNDEEETTTPAAETTTETTAADTETITTTMAWETTTEFVEETTAEEPMTEEPGPEPTRPPRTTTAARPRTTASAGQGTNCSVCICNTWSQRIHRWNPPPRQLHRFTDGSCLFCGQSWISNSFSRSQRLSNRSSRRPTFNRRNGFLMGRVGGGSYHLGFGGVVRLSDQRRFPQLRYSLQQKAFNRRLMFGNSFLFG